MEQQRLHIDGKVLCRGVRQAASRSKDPILCFVRADSIHFIAVSGLRLVITWETKLSEPVDQNQAFLIPPLVAGLLASDIVCSQVGVEFVLVGRRITARLVDYLGSYDISWESDLASFPSPDAFGQILAVPANLMPVPYIRFSDATHQAVASLVQIESDEQVSPTKLAILIDLDFGRLRVDGREIITTESRQYYFDPRLVIRALEFAKDPNLQVGVTPLPGEDRAYLSLLFQDGSWTIHCSLLSIGMDTQKLYPLPPGRDR